MTRFCVFCDKNETNKNPLTDTMDIDNICVKCLLKTHFSCGECRQFRSKFEKIDKERLIKEHMYHDKGFMMCIDCFTQIKKKCPTGMPLSECYEGNRCNQCRI